MTNEENSKKDGAGPESAATPPKTKRKIVVSHTPLTTKHTQGTHPEETIQFSATPQKKMTPDPYEEEALLAAHKAPVYSASAAPHFTPVDMPSEVRVEEKQKTSGSGVPLFFSFLALLGTVVISYFGIQLYFQMQASLHAGIAPDKFNTLETEAKAHTEALRQLQDELAKSQALVTALKADQENQVTALKGSLEATQTRVAQGMGRSEAAWQLAEVQFLVRMAKERLVAFQDIPTALYQLQAADDRLKQLSDPSLLSLREAIAKEVAAIKSVQKPDRDGIWIALGKLEAQIQTLPTAKPKLGITDPTNVDAHTDLPAWQKAGLNTWQEIKSLVRVRHHTGELNLPILADSELVTLRHAISLEIAQARLATLQGNVNVYQGSLKTIKSWLTLYFEATPALKQTLTDIDALNTQTISVQLPDLSGTLALVNAASVRGGH